MHKAIIIIVATVIIIAIVTLIRYFTGTGVFRGRKTKGSKNDSDKS